MTALAHDDWQALGTTVRLVVADGDLDTARSVVETVLDEVDRSYSRFLDDSELAEVERASGRPVTVGPLLVRAVQGALSAARWTGGAVDPTVGHAVRAVGYDRDLDAVRGGAPPVVHLADVAGWTVVHLDPARRVLRVPRGVCLDLGATGKGLAADLAASAAARNAGPGSGVLVSLGGDIATAGTAPPGGWRVLVAEDGATDPSTPGPADEVIAFDRGALATSSTTLRRWRTADGTEAHHLIDPRTGRPTDGPWRTATVAAATAERANAAATAAIVLGSGAAAWLARVGLPARLVDVDGRITTVGAWPAHDLPRTA